MSTSSELGQLLKVYWALLLGNVVEWYEYAVYGYLATYLERQFFRGSRIAVWLGFGVTFLARPLGGVVLGVVGDTWGRSTAVNMSIVGMILGTVGQGCLPTYSSGSDLWGTIGLCGLIVLRLIQGLSAAGEISTISTYLVEVGSHRTLGRLMSLINITASAGFLSAMAMVYLVRATLGPESFEAWGWRLPFLFALIPGLVAVWGRRGVPESDMFLQQREAAKKAGGGDEEAQPGENDCGEVEPAGKAQPASKTPSLAPSSTQILKEAIVSHWPNMLIGTGGVTSFAILQYGGFVWIQSFLAHHGMPDDGRMIVGLCARGLMIALGFPVGWLTDVMGVGCVMLVGSLGIAVLGVPLWAVLQSDPTSMSGVLLSLGLGLAVLGTLVGTSAFLFVVELFPTDVRNTAVGISYNVGFALFGGLAPMLAQASSNRSPYGPGLLYAAGGAVTAVSVSVGLCLQRRKLVQMAHVRREPYCTMRCGTREEARSGTSSSE